MSEPERGDVRPALSASEWAALDIEWPEGYAFREGADVRVSSSTDSGSSCSRAHALAALCLHGQPFGFDRADVATLRKMLDEADWTDRGPPGMGYSSDTRSQEIGRLHSLADRLEALLPPEDQT